MHQPGRGGGGRGRQGLDRHRLPDVRPGHRPPGAGAAQRAAWQRFAQAVFPVRPGRQREAAGRAVHRDHAEHGARPAPHEEHQRGDGVARRVHGVRRVPKDGGPGPRAAGACGPRPRAPHQGNDRHKRRDVPAVPAGHRELVRSLHPVRQGQQPPARSRRARAAPRGVRPALEDSGQPEGAGYHHEGCRDRGERQVQLQRVPGPHQSTACPPASTEAREPASMLRALRPGQERHPHH
mmetsp:Transcript_64320/g.181046  ORF Transcript_64320/g.181046 Transcript_64320/m.181046 type:complete len:237 (-) Transcript_64320:135-845(-)